MEPIPLDRLRSSSEAHRALMECLSGGWSAALVRLPLSDALVVARLDAAAHSFFEDTPVAEKERCFIERHIAAVGPVPVRIGWRQPSEAKECIRWFTCRRSSRRQPPVCGMLDRLGRTVQQSLHSVLEACLHGVLSSLVTRPVTTESVENFLHDELLDDAKDGVDPFSNFAMDVFYYYNHCQRGLVSCVPNCAPHIDRGFLSAVVVSRVEGLQLRNRHTSKWSLVKDIWPSATPCADVVVLCNAELESVVSALHFGPNAPELIACTHAVTTALKPRVSISYELRPDYGSSGTVERCKRWLRGLDDASSLRRTKCQRRGNPPWNASVSDQSRWTKEPSRRFIFE